MAMLGEWMLLRLAMPTWITRYSDDDGAPLQDQMRAGRPRLSGLLGSAEIKKENEQNQEQSERRGENLL